MYGVQALAEVPQLGPWLPGEEQADSRSRPERERIEHVFLAGVAVPDARVLELARRLRAAQLDETAEKLEGAWSREVRVLGLEITDREAILRVLEEGAEGLAELRVVLLQEHVGRVRDGLA